MFISHKKEDEAAAVEIGRFLTDVCDLDIYLDIEDCVLKEAVSIENDESIWKSIKKGLECSTHLLCLVSDKTRLSWWVPFEIGYAEKKNVDIAVVQLKNIDDIPSYLKVKRKIRSKKELFEYCSSIVPHAELFRKSALVHMNEVDSEQLDKYI